MSDLGYSFYPTHPGEVLKDEFEARGISQRDFATKTGMSYSALNDLLNCKRELTPAMALVMETSLDLPADSLMFMQTKYNMQTARKDSKILKMLSRIPHIAALW